MASKRLPVRFRSTPLIIREEHAGTQRLEIGLPNRREGFDSPYPL
jgi:hypothetical protein